MKTGEFAIFNSFMQLQYSLTSISGFLEVLKEGWDSAREPIKAKRSAFVNEYVSGPNAYKYFTDPEAIKEKALDNWLLQKLTDAPFASADHYAKASVIVFDHSILDATLMEYCRASDILSPDDWDTTIKDQMVKFTEVVTYSPSKIREGLIANCFDKLERESLLKKADCLYRVCKPATDFSGIKDFKFNREDLERFDLRRHDLVHGRHVDLSEVDIFDVHEYVNHIGTHFFLMLQSKYGFKIDEESAKRATTDMIGY